MSKAFSSDSEALSEINVVPLVDIILVVLIIFMVTAPMIMKPNINVNLPKAGSGEKAAPTKLNITLAKDGHIYLNGQPSNESEVRLKASGEIAKDAQVQAIIAADKDVPHGRVVGILDLVKSVGVKRFAISIEKQ